MSASRRSAHGRRRKPDLFDLVDYVESISTDLINPVDYVESTSNPELCLRHHFFIGRLRTKKTR